MSLCVNNSHTNYKKIKTLVENNTTKKIEVDMPCKHNTECESGYCEIQQECLSIFKSPHMCENRKVCKTSGDVSKYANYFDTKNV